LDPDEKIDLMHQMFPDYSKSIINDPNIKTVYDALKQAHQDGYTKVRIIVGDDRVKDFSRAIDYNGKLFDFSDIETISAGKRNPKAKGVEGMSASKLRQAAAENDFKTFRSGFEVRNKDGELERELIDNKTTKLLFNTVRKKMNVEEGWNLWQIAPKFDWANLRENYVSNKIFRVGDVVENLNTGLIGEIIRRGTNYLICVTEDNVMFKSWIKDVMEKVVNYPGPSGVPANQREIGTDSNREYAMRLTGTKYIKNFIDKYKKKK
jgi:phosphoribosylformylglycinamidine (FGAM) synthase PurS component